MDEPQPTMAPAGRLAARIGRPGLRWLYALVAIPVITDIIETGSWPKTAREWLTEVVAGLVIAALVHQVRKEHLIALTLARSDALTGLGNRRAFADALADECARADRSQQPVSLIYIDVDHFKQINDREGHARGDQVLRQVAAAITHTARARLDRAFRVGGDEFAVLLPGSTAAQSELVLTRMREICCRLDPAWTGGSLGLSAGIVEREGKEDPDGWVRRADAAMYRQKAARR